MWAKSVRPALLLLLEAALPVVDVAKLAVAYIDGSGPLFVTMAESGSDEEAALAAATPAAAQS